MCLGMFFSSVTSFKDISRVDFCSSFFSSIVVKIERHLVRKQSMSKSSTEKKLGELKLIQYSVKVSFQGQRNPQKCKNRKKITSFKACDLLYINYIFT